MPETIIGIPTYNGASRLRELLRSIELRTPRDLSWHAVVVDDGSPRVHETRQVIEEFTGRLPLDYIEHGSNRGIAAGWNTATRARASEHVVLINDDVVVPSGGWLDAILHPLKHSPGKDRIGGVGANWHAFTDADVAKLLESPTSDREVVPRDPGSKQQAPDRRWHEKANPGRVMCPTGQLFAFRRSDFDAAGGFDEGYTSFYEESDFHTTLASRGKIGVQLNWPMCWHRWSATFGANPELAPSARMEWSRRRYIEKWQIPPQFQTHNAGSNVFDYTNPKFMNAIPAVEVAYLRPDGSEGRVRMHPSGQVDSI